MTKAKLNIEEKHLFREAIKFSKTLSEQSRHTLFISIQTLNRLRKNVNAEYTLHISPDGFCKHSFRWCILKHSSGTLYFNGGLILHGFQETFSVELCPATYPHWSIHT